MRIIEFFGGPGSGKTTLATTVFSHLKQAGAEKVEFVREYAQQLIYQRQEKFLDDQLIVVAGQYQLYRQQGYAGANLVLSDSSMLLSLIYGKDKLHYAEMCELIYSLQASFNITKVFVQRRKRFQQFGRMQDEKAAKDLDKLIYNSFGYDLEVPGNHKGAMEVIEWIQSNL